MDPRSFLFLLCSTRVEGNSEQLARVAAAALPPQAEQRWLRLDELALPPFRDLRHPTSRYASPTGAERELAEATLAATDLVFVTPVYWYSLPASAKLYLDHWSAWMRAADLDFTARMAGKRLWAVVVDSSEPDERAYAPLTDCLVLSADYLKLQWMGALHGHGNRPGDALTAETRHAAASYFARTAPVAGTP